MRPLRFRPALLTIVLLVAGSPASTQQAVPVPADTGSVPQIEALQERLLASQQTIATLERELADARNRAVALDQCRTKNGRLVSIGRQLIEGFERRYRKGTHHDPLQLGRRRFEFELQALTDVVYDNKADVPIRLPGAEAGASDEPAPAPAVQDKRK